MRIPMFQDIYYLQRGSAIQQKAYNLLSENALMDILSPFNPVLIGTIPIDIAVADSDLDIACEVYGLKEFERICSDNFKNHKEYAFKVKTIRGKEVGIANFKIAELWIEVYAEAQAVRNQYGYRHMLKEFEILAEKGDDFKKQVLALKSQGIKTEPAFAQLLNLQGDPYESLLLYNINT